MTISHSKFAILAVPGQYVALLDMLGNEHTCAFGTGPGRNLP